MFIVSQVSVIRHGLNNSVFNKRKEVPNGVFGESELNMSTMIAYFLLCQSVSLSVRLSVCQVVCLSVSLSLSL